MQQQQQQLEQQQKHRQTLPQKYGFEFQCWHVLVVSPVERKTKFSNFKNSWPPSWMEFKKFKNWIEVYRLLLPWSPLTTSKTSIQILKCFGNEIFRPTKQWKIFWQSALPKIPAKKLIAVFVFVRCKLKSRPVVSHSYNQYQF